MLDHQEQTKPNGHNGAPTKSWCHIGQSWQFQVGSGQASYYLSPTIVRRPIIILAHEPIELVGRFDQFESTWQSFIFRSLGLMPLFLLLLSESTGGKDKDSIRIFLIRQSGGANLRQPSICHQLQLLVRQAICTYGCIVAFRSVRECLFIQQTERLSPLRHTTGPTNTGRGP